MSGLSDFAAGFGEIEPRDVHGDLHPGHTARLMALSAAAPLLPVRSPQDAALAVCAAAQDMGDILAHDLTEAEVMARAMHAQKVLAQIARWLDGQGAPPLRSMWFPGADPTTPVCHGAAQ